LVEPHFNDYDCNDRMARARWIGPRTMVL